MTRGLHLLRFVTAAGAALIVAGAGAPMFLTQVEGGMWEVSGASPAAKTPTRMCVADVSSLARFEHRGRNCAGKILKSSASATVIDYSCGFAGFGHSEVEMLTPRSLRIATQGISDGAPFAYVLQARRVGDCQSGRAPARH
jgi:hypothetical protein